MALIVDLAGHSAVYTTRLFAEAGHDVIRVESPDGDALRRQGPFIGGDADVEHGSYHLYLNAGKRSLALDVTSDAGREALGRLLDRADAVVGSAPLPFHVEEARARNSKLLVVEVREAGPEICAYAKSGLLAITGHPGQRPVLLGGHIVYAATGLYVATAMACGLLVQQATSQGQRVTVSIQETLEALAEQAMLGYVSEGKTTERRGYRGAVTAISGAFPASDGYWMISVPYTAEGWTKFMEWVGDPVLTEDKALVDEAERAAKRDWILDRLEQWSKRFPKNDSVEEAQRRHIPASPVATALDLAHDPQLKSRGFLQEIDHPEFGKMNWPRGPIGTVWDADVGLAPKLGEHSAAILADLGYSGDDLRALVRGGA